jgi:hypothetical protein
MAATSPNFGEQMGAQWAAMRPAFAVMTRYIETVFLIPSRAVTASRPPHVPGKRRPDCGRLAGRRVRLCILLTDADLFSLQFVTV